MDMVGNRVWRDVRLLPHNEEKPEYGEAKGQETRKRGEDDAVGRNDCA